MGTRISGRATFGGIASGLDTGAIIDGLMQIERQPLQRIQSRRNEVDAQRGLMRQLNTRLLALRDAARNLDNRNTRLTDDATNEEFLKYTSSSTNEDVVQVTAGFGAAPGDIQIRVDQLARGSRRFSTTFAVPGSRPEASRAIALQSGQSITIALPNGDPDATPDPVDPTSITITAGASETISLTSLRDRINSSEENGGKVRADILTVSEGNYQLVLTSTGTGSENELSVTGDLAMQAPNADGSDNAQSAVFFLFGQRIERQSNDVDDVLAGVTLNLKNVAERDDNDQPITETVSIKTDFDAVAASLQGFVDAYNDVVSFIDNQSKYNDQTKTAGPLSGDFMVREVQRRLREVASEGYVFSTNPNNPFAPGGLDENGKPLPGGAISAIGIEFVGDGKLRLNKDRLKEALAQDANMVREFLSGRARADGDVENQRAIDKALADNVRIDAFNAAAEAYNQTQTDPKSFRALKDRVEVPEPDLWDAGFFTNLGEQLEGIVRTGDGLLAERDRQFATRLRQIDDSIDVFNTRLASREELLVQRFTALERVVSGLQNQQGFLGSLR
ncbi:flagellar filament capping protein FliD [Myxococcota bacterium]|nr:flagellar filament capping protein FliD [Myxococcota bacterium]